MRMNQKLLVVIAFSILLGGCATDPVKKVLLKYKYAPIISIPSKQHVGDIYRSKDLRTTPVLLMRDLFSEEYNEKLMGELKGEVIVPEISRERIYSLKADTDFLGYAEAELDQNNVSKYSVKLKGVYQYIISEDKFKQELFPAILEKSPVVNLEGTYIVLALLQASELDYELFNETGNKIEILAGSELEDIIKGKIGGQWEVNENQNLSFTSPHFIGYRLGRIKTYNDELFVWFGEGDIVPSWGWNPLNIILIPFLIPELFREHPWSSNGTWEVYEVPPSEIRKIYSQKSGN